MERPPRADLPSVRSTLGVASVAEILDHRPTTTFLWSRLQGVGSAMASCPANAEGLIGLQSALIRVVLAVTTSRRSRLRFRSPRRDILTSGTTVRAAPNVLYPSRS